MNTRTLALLTAFVLSCGGGSQGESAPAPTSTSLAPASVGRVVGVTTDDPTVGTADQVAHGTQVQA